MNVNKAIIKQNKSLKRVLFFNCFIFVSSIMLLFFASKIVIGFKMVLMILSMFSLVSMSSKIEEDYLKYKVRRGRIYIKTGIMDTTTIIRNKKVVIVHTEGIKKEMKIIIVIVCNSKKRNFKSVKNNIFRKNRDLYNYFKKIKKENRNSKFYYTTIINGGYNKYKLLNDIYSYCEDAFFSNEAINNIKLYKNLE